MRRALALVALLAAAAPAAAATRGARLCEVLGWSAGERRVYVREVEAAGDSAGVVRAFDLRAADPTAAREAPWSATPGAAHARALAALRARLAPLERVPAPALAMATRLVGVDTLRLITMQEYPRRRLRVELAATPALPPFEVSAFGSTQVTCAGVYRVPGRAERVVVLAFQGDPEWDGRETQVPVLVRAGESAARPVAWGVYGR